MAAQARFRRGGARIGLADGDDYGAESVVVVAILLTAGSVTRPILTVTARRLIASVATIHFAHQAGLLAAILPMQRAASAEPIQALRTEQRTRTGTREDRVCWEARTRNGPARRTEWQHW